MRWFIFCEKLKSYSNLIISTLLMVFLVLGMLSIPVIVIYDVFIKEDMTPCEDLDSFRANYNNYKQYSEVQKLAKEISKDNIVTNNECEKMHELTTRLYDNLVKQQKISDMQTTIAQINEK